jgi:ATP adenylyltransferase
VSISGEGPDDDAPDDDGFERLWSPDRLAYIEGENKPTNQDAGPQCPFCRAPSLSDEEGLVVHRGIAAFVVLNRYPYNTAHVLICPFRHVRDYADLDGGERSEMSDLLVASLAAIRRAYDPQGFNVGMNIGSAAGAGIAGHLHQHVVPRWNGDTNFMPVVGRTKVLPELLADTLRRLQESWGSS